MFAFGCGVLLVIYWLGQQLRDGCIRPKPSICASGTEEMTETAERIVLASRPLGEPTLDNFRLEEFPVPQPGPGQMLLRTLWLSLDP
jgi:hypothetical protein